MPQLYATEQTRKETNKYVTRHFSSVGWLYRNQKSAPRQNTNETITLEDDKDEDMEDVVGVSARRSPSFPSNDQPDTSGPSAVCPTYLYQKDSTWIDSVCSCKLKILV